MEGTLLRVRTLTDIVGSPAPSVARPRRPRAVAARAPPGKGDGGVAAWAFDPGAPVGEFIREVLFGWLFLLAAFIYVRAMQFVVRFIASLV